MTNEEMQKLMEFIVNQQAQITSRQADMVEQQAKAEARQTQFEESTNKKIDFLLDQQAKINTNVQLLTEIALTSALDSDQLKQEIREHFSNLDSRVKKLEEN